MRQLAVFNPFNAPVYHEDVVDSTMKVSRALALRGEPHGTVITADFQEAGRGRIQGRSWNTDKSSSLLFTVLLRYPRIEAIPPALTLRTGLATALAIEDFGGTALGGTALAGKVLIKWPNDIMIFAKKAVGILAEADGGDVHIGIGVNVAQKQFPDFLRDKATSIALAAGTEIASEERFTLLGKILARLHTEIETAAGADWKSRIEERLYQKGEPVSFAEGAADSGKIVNGILSGIGPGGELLIAPNGSPGSQAGSLSFTAGELLLYR